MNGEAQNPKAVVQLDYGQPPPRRRKIIRRTLLAICVLGVSLAAWRLGPGAWRQAQILYWQRQCMNYVATMDEVAYDETTVARPECWDRLMSLTRFPVGVLPPSGREPIVFMGELKNPAGQRRLVVVGAMPDTSRAWQFPDFFFHPVVIEPGTLWTEPRVVGGFGMRWGGSNHHRKGPLEIRMGQRDPNDPTRFTIHYSVDGVKRTAYGVLDAKDGVRLAPSPGSAASPQYPATHPYR